MRFNNIALAAAAALTLVGCGCGGNQQGTDMNTPAQPGGAGRAPTQKVGKHLKVGIVFDSGGRGDKSFNDSAYAGTELAKKDMDLEVVPVESRSPKDYEQNLTTLADTAQCDLVLAIGISQNKAVESVSSKFKKVKFAIVDAVVDKPNVRSLVFAEHEGSFLAGYIAGATSKSNKIGFVGGMQIPLIKKFEAGFAAGAKTANPKVEVLPAKYTDSWDDIDKGKAAADVLFNGGADIVYHAAGRCGIGVIKAAKERGKYAVGVDSDQDDVEKGSVLTSMIKRVDQAVYQTIKDTATDKFSPGTKVYDLKANGVGISDMRNTKDVVGKDTIAKVAKIADQIKKGTLKVPSTPEQLTQYLAKMPAAGAATTKPK